MTHAAKRICVSAALPDFPGKLIPDLWIHCMSFLPVKGAYLASRINKASAQLFGKAIRQHVYSDGPSLAFLKNAFHRNALGFPYLQVIQVHLPALKVLNFNSSCDVIIGDILRATEKEDLRKGALLIVRSGGYLGTLHMDLLVKILGELIERFPLFEEDDGFATLDQFKLELYTSVLKMLPHNKRAEFNGKIAEGNFALEAEDKRSALARAMTI